MNRVSNPHVSVGQDRLHGRAGGPRVGARRRGDSPHDQRASRPLELAVGLQVSFKQISNFGWHFFLFKSCARQTLSQLSVDRFGKHFGGLLT